MFERTLRFSLIMVFIVTSLSNCDETTHQYLENAVRSLKSLRQLETLSRTGTAKQAARSKIYRRSHQYVDGVPPLALTKGELAAMYDQAVAKGETLKLDTGNHDYVHALVHHLDDDGSPEKPMNEDYTSPGSHDYPSQDHDAHDYGHDTTHHDYNHDTPHPESTKEDGGFYYYYYPIKSFLDEISSQPTEEDHSVSYHKPSHHHKELTTYKPPFTYHSHHHQHNITIQKAVEKKEEKPMEHPLIMALSGFIGMAVMLVFQKFVLPKFEAKPKVNGAIKRKDDLDDFARFAMNAIDGNCAERFACELTKTARSFEIEDNRFYKLLKRVAPGAFGRYIQHSRKYANKQLQCTAIPCARKRPNNNQNKIQIKKVANPNQKNKKNNANKKL
ncbi:uncharacterized protein LOC109540942 isoform X1 [Dendroctonus ponderosae]|uniref:uncharacterized protein LOC109540942 isoform X1 n=1 Tax=Dendroctonus ponderosae TaxID=77166 RepID=UPI0020358446|nr:uncharacterized protein LOC109540942 isoform X1 [Dendroctonus ponderosae]KAH1029970.1 hypothetical protein HUJ05_003114 [Dendroctonus ponderosae]